jgi:two-component system, cell cycle sensor histidine kinase and response regulator CckA
MFDLTIPGGSGGKEMIGVIRSRYPDLPIIVGSGYAEDPIIARPKEFGFTASISKPFSKKDLAVVLNGCMG